MFYIVIIIKYNEILIADILHLFIMKNYFIFNIL